MIKIISGVYGHYIDGRVVPKDKNSAPFELTAEQEERLVQAGVAVYVEDAAPTEDGAPIGFDEHPPELPELPDGVIGIPEYSVNLKATELREIGKLCGLSFPVGMTKAEMVAALDKHIEENMEDDVEAEGDEPDDPDAPAFDAADAVVE